MQTPRLFVEPYQVPEPDYYYSEDEPAAPFLGHAETITEYSKDYMNSLEYKQARAAAKEKGKLGF